MDQKNNTFQQFDNTELCIILCTVSNECYAKDIAKRLLENNLAACVTLLPNVTSIYYWNGKLEHQTEVQLIIKSKMILWKTVLMQIKMYHPYKIPELLVLPIIGGNPDYISWVNDSLQ